MLVAASGCYRRRRCCTAMQGRMAGGARSAARARTRPPMASGRRAKLHITFRELRAVRYVVQAFLPMLRSRRVLLYEDNQAVVAMLTNMVSHSPLMMRELRVLSELLSLEDISLQARYIRSAENYVADYFSRLAAAREYVLSRDIFERVRARFHRLDRGRLSGNFGNTI